ncbi:MAG: ABC-type transport auxiliary lipoprotein family protein [Myxococcota bacterium]|nr:ABC-type transport auxiliary lipoprotein family protein [Myxococcota bacterium]
MVDPRILRYLLTGLSLFFLACGSQPTRSYYTLTYPTPAPMLDKPLAATLRLQEVVLRDSYKRSEVVLRPDAYEIRYDRRQRWSERPQKMITALLLRHLKSAHVFQRVVHRDLVENADYVLRMQVSLIEQAQAGQQLFARLETSWQLLKSSDDSVIWSWSVESKKAVGTTKNAHMRATIRALSHLLADHTTQALTRMIDHFTRPSVPAQPPRPMRTPSDVAGPDDEVVDWSKGNPLNDWPGLMSDNTSMGVGFGAIFLPALSGTSRVPREPSVAIYDGADQKQVTTGRMGRRIVLSPGLYTVHFGSGTAQQQRTVKVRVRPDRTTVVPPRWGALSINVVDNTFVPFRGSYELIRMSTGEEYGLGVGADDQQGEQLRVWVLPPDLYKIIRTGGTYYDRTDFATVRISEGAFRQFILVIDPDTGEFEGAGEIDPRQMINAGSQDWTFRGILGGSVSFTKRDQQVDTQEGWTMDVSAFFEGRKRLNQGVHWWDTRLDIEESQRRDPQTNYFSNIRDRFFINSIYMYRVWPSFGPYLRLRLDTKLLPRYQAFSAAKDVQKADSTGACQSFKQDVDRVELGGAFSPLELRESAGGNFVVFRRRSVDLDVRLGFAMQQTLTNGLLNFDEPSDCLFPVENSEIYGPEATVVGFVRLSRWVTLSTEFDGLLPIGAEDGIYTWRNQASLRLATFLSLNYRLNIEYKPTLSDETQMEQDVQLRFSYPVF